MSPQMQPPPIQPLPNQSSSPKLSCSVYQRLLYPRNLVILTLTPPTSLPSPIESLTTSHISLAILLRLCSTPLHFLASRSSSSFSSLLTFFTLPSLNGCNLASISALSASNSAMRVCRSLVEGHAAKAERRARRVLASACRAVVSSRRAVVALMMEVMGMDSASSGTVWRAW